MDFLDYELFSLGGRSLSVNHLVYVVAIYLSAKLFIWFIKKMQ